MKKIVYYQVKFEGVFNSAPTSMFPQKSFVDFHIAHKFANDCYERWKEDRMKSHAVKHEREIINDYEHKDCLGDYVRQITFRSENNYITLGFIRVIHNYLFLHEYMDVK